MTSYRVNQIKVPLSYSENDLLKAVCRKLRIKPESILSMNTVKKSIDARSTPVYKLSVTLEISVPTTVKSHDIVILKATHEEIVIPSIKKQAERPVVIGAGPAGLTAAWYLAKAGLDPILLERGVCTEERALAVQLFWNTGTLNEDSNTLFGEGGAGLFSDGKLTARSKDRGKVRAFLELLVHHGASENILIDAHPHIGTDKLQKIVPSIRQEIIALGGEVWFGCKAEKIIIEKGMVTGIETHKGLIKCNRVIIAVGHSARDTYAMLYKAGVALQKKPFAVGIRLELSQKLINKNRYKNVTIKDGPASFRLTHKEEGEIRACYSFCMCPGGQVISCASEAGFLTSNGMSYSKRSLPYGNAAFLVLVRTEEYAIYGDSPLSGIEFQRDLEKKAFFAGGSDYALPASDLKSFLEDKEPISLPADCSPHRIKKCNLNLILPDFIKKTLKTSIPQMLKELGSPPFNEIILYGTETRSSAPLQICRTKSGESINTAGLFPAGEGSGYAGGIVSSGIDGIKSALSVINSLR